jgi:hypothetical protein
MERRGLDCASLTLLAWLCESGVGGFSRRGAQAQGGGTFYNNGSDGSEGGASVWASLALLASLQQTGCGKVFPAGALGRRGGRLFTPTGAAAAKSGCVADVAGVAGAVVKSVRVSQGLCAPLCPLW